MSNNRHILTGALSIVCLGVLLSCAAPRVSQNVMMPARASGMQDVKKLAVVRFAGDRNNEFSTKLEAFLANIRVRDQAYFTVVDRSSLDTILREQRMVNESGLFNEQDAVKLGQLSGADTIISGFVKWPTVEESNYREERSVCVEYQGKDECKKWTKKQVRCSRQVSLFEFTVKAISVQKGEISFTENYKGEAHNKYCADSTAKRKLPSELIETVIASAMGKMRQDVAPYSVVMTIALMDEDESGLADNKKAQSLLESGLAFAEKNRFDRACEQFRQAVAVYDKSPALYHNMGVCAEIDGNLDKALRMYQRADGLLLEPNDTISAALVRIQERIQNDQQVATQLR